MPKFRSTDNPTVVLEFNEEHDVRAMRMHPNYEEVTEEVKQEVKPGAAKKKNAD